MEKLIRTVINSAIPPNESVKKSDFLGSVRNLQEKIIDIFRYCSLQFLPPFLDGMLNKIDQNSHSQDKKARFSTAICLTALINLFPNDEFVYFYQPIIKKLLVPGYRPIIEFGAIVLDRFARISGPNRNRALTDLIEQHSIFSEKSVSTEVKYTAAVIWKELAHSYPEGFYNMKSVFIKEFYEGIKKTKNDKVIYYLLIEMMTELFQSEAASVGVSFLEDFHESLLQNMIETFISGNVDQMHIIFDLLQVILTIPPFIDKQTAGRIYTKCKEGLDSKHAEIITYSINIILLLLNQNLISKPDELMKNLFDRLILHVKSDWKAIEPILIKLIIFFTEEDDSLTKIEKIYQKLPKQDAALYAFHLTFSVLNFGKVKNISPYLESIIKYNKESKTPIPIQDVLNVLNLSYKDWFENSYFKGKILYAIRQELSRSIFPNDPTERLIISLKALRQIPSFTYINAIELKNLIMKLTDSLDFELRALIVPTVLHLFHEYPNQIPLDTIFDLVRFALNDPVIIVRKKSLKAFTEITYQYLEQQDIFSEFYKFSYDESPEIRKEALNIIKNLKTFDLAMMRHLLLSSINLINSNFGIIIPETTPVWVVFPNLINASKPIIHVYAESFFNIFYKMLTSRFIDIKLQDTTHILMNSAIMKEIDESLIKSVTKLYLLCPEIIPVKLILDVFCSVLTQSVHPWTKENVLKSLKNIAEKTIITDSCPNIFNALQTVIQQKESIKLVTKALKVMGVVGVADIPLNPPKERLFLRSALTNVLYFNQYILSIYFKYLNDSFDSNNIDSTRKKIASCVVNIYYADSGGVQEHLEPFLSKYLNYIKYSSTERIPDFLLILEGIVLSAGYLIIPYTDRIFQAIEEHWHNKYTSEASKVFTQLVKSTEGQCDSILHLLVSTSFVLIRSKKEIQEEPDEIFKLLRAIANYCPDHLQSIIDGAVKIMSTPGSPSYLQQQSLDTIKFIINNIDPLPHLPMITRCLLNVSNRSQMIWREQARKLLDEVNSIRLKNMDIYTIQSSQNRPKKKKNNRFLNNPYSELINNNAESFDEFVRSSNINSVEEYNFTNLMKFFNPPEKIIDIENDKKPSFLKEADSNIIKPKNVFQWFDDLCHFLIKCSHSKVILTMIDLPSLPHFAFEFAFYAIWPHFSQSEKKKIVEKLNNIFIKASFPASIMSQFIGIVEFAVLAEMDLGVDLCSVINACISSKFYAKALFFLENYPNPEILPEYTQKLINMNIALCRNDEARCLANDDLKRCKVDVSVWMSLSEWETALELINKNAIRMKDDPNNNNTNGDYNDNNNNIDMNLSDHEKNDKNEDESDYMTTTTNENENTVYFDDNSNNNNNNELSESVISKMDKKLLINLVQCLASMENWREIKEMKSVLLNQSKRIQSKLARFMWMAEIFQGTKEEALQCVNLTGGYTVADCIDKSILYIHLQMYEQAKDSFHLAWRYLASSICNIEKNNRQQMTSHIFQAEQLHELSEVINMKNDPSLADNIIKSWRARLKFIREDPEKQKELFKIRSLVSDIIDPTEFAYNILQSTKRTSKGIENIIDLFFPDPDSYDAQYCRIKLIENKEERIEKAKDLLKKVDKTDKNENIIKRLNNFIGKEIFEVASSYDDLTQVSSFLLLGQKNYTLLSQVQILRALYQKDEEIAISAINENLINCIDSNIAMVLNQLEAMTIQFPKSKKVYEAVISIYQSNYIKPSSLKYIKRSCVLSLCDQNQYVVDAARVVCSILATQIPDSIMFDLVSNQIRYQAKSKVFQDLLNVLQSNNPLFFSQMTRIINKLEAISHTLFDKIIEQLKLCFEAMTNNEFVPAFKILKKISKTLNQTNVTRYDNEFMDRFKRNSGKILDQLISKGTLNDSDRPLIQKIIVSTIKKQDAVRVIPLSSLDVELGTKTNWSVSIFGKESGTSGGEDLKIVKFFHSVQRLDNGLRIAVINSNGKKYSFHLLRGERYHVNQSEQFMSLLNALTPIHFTQRTMTELNPNLTLTEFLKGKVQLFDLIIMYQQSKGRNPDEEFSKIQEIFMTTGSKRLAKQLKEKIGVNDVDNLKKVLLITSKNATVYINKTTMFAKTMGTMAAVSYIIGGADNSPRGILIDKTTGEVAYANFRVTGLNQNVPFRLTRMINYAFGPCGVRGPFMTSLIKALKGIRKYSNALATCIQFALGDPPFDPNKLPRQYLGRYSVVQTAHRNTTADLFSPSSSIDYAPDSDDENDTNPSKIDNIEISPLINSVPSISTSTTSSSSALPAKGILLNSELFNDNDKAESKDAIDRFYKRVAGVGNDINAEVDHLIKKAQNFNRLITMPISFYSWW